MDILYFGHEIEETALGTVCEYRNGLEGEWTKKIVITYDNSLNVAKKEWKTKQRE